MGPWFCVNSKGDINSAAKFLEMFVSVAESAGLQENLADACSAIGTMYNTMVWKLESNKQNLHLGLRNLAG